MRFKKIVCEAYGSFTISADGPMIISSTVKTKLTPENADTIFIESAVDKNNNAFIIPGSSIKGVIRHYIETTSYFRKMLNCNSKEEFSKKINGFFGGTDPAEKSKICFFDAYADMSTIKTSLRTQTKIDAISQEASRGSLNSILAVTQGDFKCDYSIKNFSAKELELFINAIKAMDSGEICIGGRVSRGYGMVHINDFRIVISKGFDENLQPEILFDLNSISDMENALPDIKKICMKDEVN